MANPTQNHSEAVDSTARSQITGLRGEFHEFRVEIKSDVDSMRNEIGSGFAKVFNRMDSDTRANLQASKSGIGMIASFALGVIGLAFSFTTLVTSPLREQDTRHTSQLDKQQDRMFSHLEMHADSAAFLGEIKARESANSTRLDRLEGLLDAKRP